MVQKRKGTQFITQVPKDSGRVVGIIEFKGQIILACENHVYQMFESDMVFKKITFQVDPPSPCPDDWHKMGWEVYCKAHGPAYPRSCPACGGIG